MKCVLLGLPANHLLIDAAKSVGPFASGSAGSGV
jgi:hypothetical protein